MGDLDNDFFPEKKSFKLSSKSYPDHYVYMCEKSYFQLSYNYRSIKSQKGDPGKWAEFNIIQARDGLCRIQCVNQPNFFIYQQYNGNVGAFYYGYGVKDEALFRIIQLADGTVALLNMKPNANKYLYMGWNGLSFSATLDESGKWIVHSDNVVNQIPEKDAAFQPKFRPSQPKRPLPRDQRLKTSEENTYDIMQYEEPRRVITNIDDFGPTAFPNIENLMQGCIFGAIAPSGNKPNIIYKQGDVTLTSQADILEGDSYANMHVKLAEHTVGNAIVQVGPCFGIRRIHRALCESVLLQCVVRLSRTKEPLPIIITSK